MMPKMTDSYYAALNKSKELTLPDWGPYSKKYFGISHVADRTKGHRMDFFVIPQIYRHNNIGIPDVLRNSNYLPMKGAPDLSFYAYRQQLEWKDRIYCDISFEKVEKDLYLVKSAFVNNTGDDLDFALHYFLHFTPNPAVVSFGGEEGGGEFFSAIDYTFLDVKASQEPFSSVIFDARRRCEQRDPNGCKGSVLGLGFGKSKGDKAVFTLPESLQKSSSKLFLRYKLSSEKVVLFVNKRYQIILNDTRNDYRSILLPPLGKDELILEVLEENKGNDDLLLDGFHGENYVRKLEDMTGAKGIVTKEAKENAFFYSHCDLSMTYGVMWDRKESIFREYNVADFHSILSYRSGLFDPGSNFSYKTGDDRNWGVCLQPITVKKGSSLEITALIGGSSDEKSMKKVLLKHSSLLSLAPSFAPVRKKLPKELNPYAFTREILSAVTISNIVYPIRLGKEWIKHHTPGRMWDSLYTWDSAFIGLGLLEMDPGRAVENLNTYLNDPSNENAFVHHGSFVPAHILLFHECANFLYGEEKEAFINYFFERVLQYYNFFAGHDPRSETASFSKAGLLRPWKVGYNSGGWDDYPAQWTIHKQQAHHILPAVTTSFAVLCAKILLPYAQRLKKKEILCLLQEDIKNFSSALQKLWDDECGFFSYGVHDEQGVLQGFYRTEEGENYNKGLDGVMPLVAGSVNKEQEKRLWKVLLDKNRFFTSCGLSCVDISASYFSPDGYANGAPWMATEYYLWKRALSCGKGDTAWKIAGNTLKNYTKELKHFRQCFEHFSISSGRGTGWHHFSSFSTPILVWCGAYYNEKLHLAGGFDLTIESLEETRATVTLAGEKGTFQTVILTGRKKDSPIFYNGKKVPAKKRTPFAWEIKLPSDSCGKLEF